MSNYIEIKHSSSFVRHNNIDFLKFIGLTGIIIAHIGAPQWAMMIRSFDVPLMVIISSLLANQSFQRAKQRNESSIHWIVTRIKRLVIPTWVFLFIFFIYDCLVNKNVESIKYYVASFCLTRYGIGYVWIILIYIYSALLIPLFDRLRLSFKGILAVFVSYAVYEIAYYFNLGLNNNQIIMMFMDTTFYYIIPYGVIAYLGYNYLSFSHRQKIAIAGSSSVVFLALVILYWVETGAFQLVGIAKFPPRIYYLSYGIACSYILLMLSEIRDFSIYGNKVITYVSKHSMWIYLWHVLVLNIYHMNDLPNNWLLKLVIVCSSSVFIVLIVNKLLDWLEHKHVYFIYKYLRG